MGLPCLDPILRRVIDGVVHSIFRFPGGPGETGMLGFAKENGGTIP